MSEPTGAEPPIAKLEAIYHSRTKKPGVLLSYFFRCPGCDDLHQVVVDKSEPQPVWEFNGDLEKPTFSPSILCFRMEGKKRITTCHSFVENGKIRYLTDSLHHLAGQTVELPEVD